MHHNATIYIMLSRDFETALGWLILGLIFFILGLGIESIADYQKFKFRRSAHVDEFCNLDYV